MTGTGADDEAAATIAVLAPVAEVALAVARRDQGDPQAPVPPRRMQPYLHFTRVRHAALVAAVEAMDADEGFRRRVADVCRGDEALTPGQRAWLERDAPDWAETFAAERDEAAAELAQQRSEHEAAAAALRIEELERALDERVARIDELEAESSRLRAEVAALTDVLSARAAELAELQDRLHAAEEGRSRAVRELKATEARDAARVERLRDVEAELEAALARSVGETSIEVPAGVDPDAVGELAGRLRDLAEELAALAEATSPEARLGGSDRTVPPSSRPGRPGGGPRERRPMRLGRGLVEGTPEGVRELLSAPRVVVLVDGWNVSMLGWPDLDGALQRRRLVDALGGVSARTGAEVHVVFDGVEEGSTPVAEGPSRVRVQFTPEGVEADDRILELIDQVDVSRPVVVVSNDRRVRDGAAARGANVVASTELLAFLDR